MMSIRLVRTYLAHHELESKFIIITVIFIIIVLFFYNDCHVYIGVG